MRRGRWARRDAVGLPVRVAPVRLRLASVLRGMAGEAVRDGEQLAGEELRLRLPSVLRFAWSRARRREVRGWGPYPMTGNFAGTTKFRSTRTKGGLCVFAQQALLGG